MTEKELKESVARLKESEKKVKKTNAELETIIDLIPGIVFCKDKNGIITRVNQNAVNFNKSNKEDMIGKTVFTLFPEDQAKKMREDDLKVINSGKPLLNLEEMANTPYGKKWLITNKVPRYNEDSEVDGIIGLVIDITERKRNEEQLTIKSKAIESSNNAIAFADLKGKIIYGNPTFLKEWGYTNINEVIGKHATTFWHKEEETSEVIKGLQNEGEYFGELVARRKNGKIFNVQLSASMVKDDFGELICMMASSIDITERKEVEERMRLLSSAIEQSIEGIAVSDLKGNLLFANNAFSDMHGYTSNELIGNHLSILHTPDQMPSVEAANQQILERGEFTGEIWHKRRDGSVFPSLMHNSLFKDEMNNPAGFIGTLLDITEKRKAAEKLRELENIINKSPAVVFLWKNKEGWPVEYVSENVKQFGYTPEEFYSGQLSYSNIVHPDDLERVATEVNMHSIEDIQEFQQEYRIISKNNGAYWIDDHTWTRRNQKGEITHYQGIILDITEKKEAREELRKSEEKYRLITENANDLIGVFNKKFEYEYVNENTFQHILGYSSKDVLEKSILKFVHPDDLSRIAKTTFEGFKRGEGEGEFRYRHKERHWVWLEAKGKTFIDRDGITKGLFIGRDITERKITEQQLKESKEAFQDAYNRMLLYQDLITHDMRNVLNSVQSLMYFYNHYRDNHAKMNEMNDLIKMINEQIVKGDILIRNVLKLSDLESKQISLKPIDVLNVLEESIKFLRNSFLNREISIQVDSGSNEFVAQVDDFLIDVFENLLNNAVKHNTNPIAEILIRIAKEERGMKKYIQLEFIDNGNGIPDNRKQLVFQRNHSKKEYTKGLGIGLSLVFKIIKNYEGEIWVEDKVKGDYSKGSKLVILIPEAY